MPNEVWKRDTVLTEDIDIKVNLDNTEGEILWHQILVSGKYWIELALLGETAESYLYSDPNACIFKIGMLAEQIVRGIFAYEKLNYLKIPDSPI